MQGTRIQRFVQQPNRSDKRHPLAQQRLGYDLTNNHLPLGNQTAPVVIIAAKVSHGKKLSGPCSPTPLCRTMPIYRDRISEMMTLDVGSPSPVCSVP